jgi:hypothetical protein
MQQLIRLERRMADRADYEIYYATVGSEIGTNLERSQDRFRVSVRPSNLRSRRLRSSGLHLAREQLVARLSGIA